MARDRNYTMEPIVTKAATTEYESGWDRIFGKKGVSPTEAPTPAPCFDTAMNPQESIKHHCHKCHKELHLGITGVYYDPCVCATQEFLESTVCKVCDREITEGEEIKCKLCEAVPKLRSEEEPN